MWSWQLTEIHKGEVRILLKGEVLKLLKPKWK